MTQCSYCVKGQVVVFVSGERRCAQCSRMPGRGDRQQSAPQLEVPTATRFVSVPALAAPSRPSKRGYIPPNMATPKPRQDLASPTASHIAERWRKASKKR